MNRYMALYGKSPYHTASDTFPDFIQRVLHSQYRGSCLKGHTKIAITQLKLVGVGGGGRGVDGSGTAGAFPRNALFLVRHRMDPEHRGPYKFGRLIINLTVLTGMARPKVEDIPNGTQSWTVAVDMLKSRTADKGWSSNLVGRGA
jgi:hypothetical protein